MKIGACAFVICTKLDAVMMGITRLTKKELFALESVLAPDCLLHGAGGGKLSYWSGLSEKLVQKLAADIRAGNWDWE